MNKKLLNRKTMKKMVAEDNLGILRGNQSKLSYFLLRMWCKIYKS